MNDSAVKPARISLPQSTSVFLDLVRVLAALAVFAVHAMQIGLLSYPIPADLGHSCVVVFFVLSGFVIAFSTLSRNQSANDYALARLSRLSSVVIPALILTALVDLVGRWMNPDFFTGYSRGKDLLRYTLSLTYLHQSWFFSAAPPANAPLWSIAYEFWYYVFFAIWIYSKNTATRLAGLAIGFLVVGPNILLLFPVWLLGVGCYHCLRCFPSSPRSRFKPSVAFWKGLFAVSSAATLLQICLPIPNPLEAHFPFGKAPLFYAGHFMADFINGCSVAISILSFNKGFASAHWPKGLVSPIKAIAERSFSLYLFHFPLLVFAKACFPTVPVNSIGMILLTCAVFAATWLLAQSSG